MASALDELEELLDTLKGWTPEDDTEEDGAQIKIDLLDKASSCTRLVCKPQSILTPKKIIARITSEDAIYSRAVRRLQVLCQKAGRLPSSCLLQTGLVTEMSEPLSKSGFSDVYCGYVGKLQVALKVLRLHVDDKTKVMKVCSIVLVILKLCLMERALRRTTVRPSYGNRSGIPISSGFLACPQQWPLV